MEFRLKHSSFNVTRVLMSYELSNRINASHIQGGFVRIIPKECVVVPMRVVPFLVRTRYIPSDVVNCELGVAVRFGHSEARVRNEGSKPRWILLDYSVQFFFKVSAKNGWQPFQPQLRCT